MHSEMPIDALDTSDMKSISSFISKTTGINNVDAERSLVQWNASKAWLFNDVFGGKLRTTVPVKAMCSDETDDIRRGVSNAAMGVMADFVDFMYDVENRERAEKGTALDAIGLLSPQAVMSGRLCRDMLFTDCGETLYIQKGTKIMRAIRKVMELYQYGNMAAFRRFRDQVSAIMTTKRLDAELVLSIHPIDYLSMGDNGNGWKTCTSMLGRGTCAVGAVEMMNSPSAVVCYVESKDAYMPGVPNKSWRMLCFADAESGTVLGGRQYPYFSEDLGKAAVETLGKLFVKKPNAAVMPYPSNDYERYVCECCDNSDVKNGTPRFNEALRAYPNDLGIAPYSFRMCNDFFMFAGNDKFYKYADGTEDCKVCLSGPATCIICGERLDASYGCEDIVCDMCGMR